MKPKQHIVVSGIISYMVYMVTKSPISGLASFLAGILIDLDHLIDYCLNYGHTYKLKEIYKAIDELRLAKVYVLLHSYEVLIVFWGLVFLVPLNHVYFAIAIGMTQHMFFDQLCNPASPKAYFLIYRIANGFKREAFVDDLKLQARKERLEKGLQ